MSTDTSGITWEEAKNAFAEPYRDTRTWISMAAFIALAFAGYEYVGVTLWILSSLYIVHDRAGDTT